ncbi:hypothetical protein CC86DRAFT_420673 [Ophiobolus disseminans]|uniref:Uncharacterized protein n=1 Tax=Ophiobolus disseminans TaxID=1469910 RepID=A0A6A6ZT08_9PLEO|nr:hypothetical protein CC86DRAFT_420673 [Ophiobolus disseminans]
MDAMRPILDLCRSQELIIDTARSRIEASQHEIEDLERQIAMKKDEIKAAEAQIEETDGFYTTLKGKVASELRQTSIVPEPRPKTMRQEHILPSSPEPSSSPDEGIILLHPKDIEGGAGWVDLVEDGLLLRCPWGWQAQYFKGSGGFISHMNYHHKEEFALVTGAGEKKKFVHYHCRQLTSEERRAYSNDGYGVHIKARVPINEIYRSWLKARREKRSEESTKDVIRCVARPEKRRRVERPPDAGPSRPLAHRLPVAPSVETQTQRIYRRPEVKSLRPFSARFSLSRTQSYNSMAARLGRERKPKE